MIYYLIKLRKGIRFITFILFLFCFHVSNAQMSAFPGALGFGANATGGREGSVYHVTNLSDSGPGSFRDAVSEPNRIIVFDVGGYITLETKVAVSSNITIAGQTAPGDGIGFKGRQISFANNSNIICRYIRVRPGSDAPRTDNGFSFYQASNIILDHVSAEFASWNNIDGVSQDWQNKPVKNITVQYSIIANPIGQQFGAHTESLDGTWSWFYNVFANSHNRNPLAKINTVFINNVLYNYQAGYTTHTGSHFKHDIINNYFIFGPATTSDNTWFQMDENQSIYYSGNLKDSLPDGILNGGITTPYWYHGTASTILTSPWSSIANEAPIYSAQDAFPIVLSTVGAMPLDQVDSLVLSQIKTLGNGTSGTGIGTSGPGGDLYTSQTQTGLPNNGFGNLEDGQLPPDRDGDGMPNYWELAIGNDPDQDDAMTKQADGYTNIEHYLHWLASPHTKMVEDDSLNIDLYEYAGGFIENNPTFSLSNVNHGDASIGSNGHFVRFHPDPSFVGKASFDFSVTIAGNIIYDTTVTILVVPKVAIEAPSDVTLTAISKKTTNEYSVITVKWRDNSDNETHFILERKAEDSTSFSQVVQLSANDSLYLDSTNVFPGKKYSYRIKAINATDSSLFSLPESITTPNLPPSPNDSVFDSSYKGLVGYWSFDEPSGNVAIDSVKFHDNGHLGTNISRINDGKSDNAIELTNMEQSGYGVKIPDAPQIYLDTSSFTISFWMKADVSQMPAEGISAYILCKGSIGTDPNINTTGKRFNLEVKNGALSFALDAGDAGENTGKDDLQTDANPLYTGEWVNVILVRDMTNQKMKIYFDGKQVAEGDIKKSKYGIGEHSALILGNIGERELSSGGFTPAPFKGKLDELKIFNYAVPPSKIIELSGFVPKGLVGYWSFDDEPQNAVAMDSTNYRNNGEVGKETKWVQGHSKNAVSFEAMDYAGYGVKIPNAPQLLLDTSSFSISFWMKADSSLMPPSDISAYILCKGSIGTDPSLNTTGKRFDLEVKNGALSFALDAGDAGGNTGKDDLQTDANPLYTGEWVNVIVIRDMTHQKMRIYFDGKQVAERDIEKSKYGIGENSSLIIGNIGERELTSGGFTPAPFKGIIDELKIFNYPISLAEILTIYAGGAYPQKASNPSFNNTIVDGYSDTLDLTWDGGINTTKYQLYMGSDSTNMELVDDSINVDKSIFNLINLNQQSSYYWRVDAVGVLGTTKGDIWHFTTGFPKGLVGYWSFDGNDSNSNVIDSTQYEDHGVLGTNINNIPGYKNDGLNLQNMNDDGFGTKIPDAPQLFLNTSSFSISFWMKADQDLLQKDVYLLCKGSIGTDSNVGTTGKRFNLEVKNGTLYFALDAGDEGNNTGKDQISADAADLATSEWVNVIVIRDVEDQRMKIYINGNLVGEGDISKSKYGIGEHSAMIVGNIGEFELSSGTFTPAPYKGAMDELKIFNYPLTDDLVQKINNDVPFLKKPTNPTPIDSSIGAGPEKVHFSWIEESGTALAYDFYFGTSADSLNLIQKSLKEPMFEIDSLSPNATYYWKVKDSSDAQQILSDTWTFTTGADTTSPVVNLKDISVVLNKDGYVNIEPSDLDSNSHDVYGIDTLLIDKTEFDCLDIGDNKVLFTAVDNYGNSSSDTAIVTVKGIIPKQPSIHPSDTLLCDGEKIDLFVSNDDADRYKWFYEGEALEGKKDEKLFTGKSGNYSVIAISSQSCMSDTSEFVSIRISSDTTLHVSNDVSINRGSSINLQVTESDKGTVSWSPDIAISNIKGKSVMVQPNQTTTYIATLTNEDGCKVSRSIQVNVEENSDFSYNRILSPNGDGINDKLVIKDLKGYPNNNLQVFDESGRLVYQKNGYDNSWDGKYKGTYLSNGTYYFVLSVNHKIVVKGSVVVVN